MKQQTNTQSYIFLFGAILMVVGAATSLLLWSFSPYIYCAGALCFVAMQQLQRYEGANTTLRRLRFIVLLSDFLFLASGLLMLAAQGNPLGLSQIDYITYVHQKWVVTLLIASIMQLYASHRISHELEKEIKKD